MVAVLPVRYACRVADDTTMPVMNDDRPSLSEAPDSATDVATIDADDEPSALDILEPGFKAEPNGRVEILTTPSSSGTPDHDADHDAEDGDREAERATIVDADVEEAPDDVVAESASSDLISDLEADIDLVDAAMSHLDNNDLDAADEAVSQLDRGAEPTLFAAVITPADDEQPAATEIATPTR